MGNFIGILLTVTGYTYEYKDSAIDPPLSIRAAAGSSFITKEATAKKTMTLATFVKYVHNFFIAIVMLWRVIYTIYMSVRDNTFVPLSRSLFQLMFVIQYGYAIEYFRKKHFYQNIATKSDMTNLFHIMAPFTIVFSLIISISFTVLFTQNGMIYGYTDLYNNIDDDRLKALLAVLLFVDTMYSYLTFMINTCIFIVNMLYHKREVSSYANTLSNDFIPSDQDMGKKITTITQEVSLMKDAWGQTVTVLDSFFQALNFIGFLSLYFYASAIKNNDITIDEITNLVIFLIVEIIYIVTIHAVNKSVSQISDAVGSTSMIAMYFTGNDFDDSHTINMYQQHKTNILESQSRAKESESLDRTHRISSRGQIIDGVLQKGRNVRVNDHDLSDTREKNMEMDEILFRPSSAYNKKPIPMDAELLSSAPSNSNTKFNAVKHRYTFDDIAHRSIPDIEPNYAQNQHMNMSIRTINTSVNGIQNVVNLMALQSIVGGTWNTFNIFGVQITDAVLISRLFGIAVSILITSEVASILNWW